MRTALVFSARRSLPPLLTMHVVSLRAALACGVHGGERLAWGDRVGFSFFCVLFAPGAACVPRPACSDGEEPRVFTGEDVKMLVRRSTSRDAGREASRAPLQQTFAPTYVSCVSLAACRVAAAVLACRLVASASRA